MTATSHKPAGHFHLPRMRAHAGTAVTEATAARYVWALARISLGFVFLWAFLDKTFGLGHETADKAAWINGGSPTNGFLSKGTSGPLADFYHNIAGSAWADWLFMLGLAGIGTALILGIGMRIAAATGALLLVMMWSAVLPPDNNIFMDDLIAEDEALLKTLSPALDQKIPSAFMDGQNLKPRKALIYYDTSSN